MKQFYHIDYHPCWGVLRFPSPCGDLVMKRVICGYLPTCEAKVSVPLRGIGYETAQATSVGLVYATYKFPSPCGELVMKPANKLLAWALSKRVSVPLRGIGYETV